jgi:hypothetical protein
LFMTPLTELPKLDEDVTPESYGIVPVHFIDLRLQVNGGGITYLYIQVYNT